MSTEAKATSRSSTLNAPTTTAATTPAGQASNRAPSTTPLASRIENDTNVADASGWRRVFEQQLEQDGLTVLAPPNPLRGLKNDAACIAVRPRRDRWAGAARRAFIWRSDHHRRG
jgi:hypothetical protein